jgi:hypothetical protein
MHTSLRLDPYIMFYSLPKIDARLHLRIPFSRHRVMIACLSIGSQDIAAYYTPVLSHPKLRKKFEAFIGRFISAYLPGEDAKLEWTDTKRRHLAATRTNEAVLWSWFRELLLGLHSLVVELREFRRDVHCPAPESGSFHGRLEQVLARLDFIEQLLYSSDAFWRLCHNDVIHEAFNVGTYLD